MNEAGEQLGAYSVIGAGADDWEDMARGPGGDGDLLYIGDIGDNNSDRSDITIYRSPTPAWPAAIAKTPTSLC